MATLEHFISIVEATLEDYAQIQYSSGNIERHTVFDRSKGRFLIMLEGWEGETRIHGFLIDVQIKGDKLWIERDGTENGVALDFERQGVPKSQIVLAFYSPAHRLLTDYPAA